jgi:hypothetical protein
MKKILIMALISSSIFATDYSSMTLDELRNLRGSIEQENKTDFQSAMKLKMQSLSYEERSALRNDSFGESSYSSSQRLRDGSGSGNMYKGSRGGGGGHR